MQTTAPSKAQPESSSEALQVLLRRAELAALIERITREDGLHTTAVPHLSLVRFSEPGYPVRGTCEPAFCVLAQGTKQILLADEVYVYDSMRYLVASQNLPVAGQVIEASPQAPYLGFRLDLDPREVAAVSMEVASGAPAARSTRGLFTGDLTTALLDASIRLVRLLETPDDIPVLAPLITREILYRLIRAEGGGSLAQVAMAGSHAQRIARAIAWLKEHYAEPLRIEDLARDLGMSASTLHHHFKAITAMSPLQYQKQLRLLEARRLLLSQAVDSATAGFRVGYESPSQFSREYSRLFGAPPARDAKRFREGAAAQAEQARAH